MKKLVCFALILFLTVLALVGGSRLAGDSSLVGKTEKAAYLSAVIGNPAAQLSGRGAASDEVGAVLEPISSSPNLQSGGGGETSSPALQAAANADGALGKIITSFFSPYSADASFGKIYMKNSTSKTVDISTELSSPIELKPDFGSQPEVLIMHTHATESYMQDERDFYTEADTARSTDNSLNMVKIGDIMAETLKKNGISVIHDATQHDADSYNGSYNRSGETVKSYLSKYPSIKVVLDVHRDSVARGDDRVKGVVEANGKQAAQIMLVMGCEDGSITDHPNWRQNLRLALRFQQAAEIMYPGLARAMMLAPRCYNQNLSSGSMLIEMGTDANTLDEASYSAELVGDILARVLKGLG